MPTAIVLCKFVGTISLGLLTGVSYTLATQSLPSLLTLPSAKPAAYTLRQTIRLAKVHIRVLRVISWTSLALAYYLSPPRIRHPYLLWTSLTAVASGGLDLLMEKGKGEAVGEDEVGDVNGEQVEKWARDRQWLEAVRTGISGLGFVMSVVGIWGDGA